MSAPPPKKRDSFPKLLFLGITTLWLAASPFVLLAIGFSGGNLVDPIDMVRNAIRLDPYAFDQMLAIAFAIYPFLFAYFLWKLFLVSGREDSQ